MADGQFDIKSSVYKVPEIFSVSSNLSSDGYSELYAASVSDPEGFWRRAGARLDWITPYTK
ncbi:MAG: acetyl-coenzyme A synthetase N-terminal domain-containing protein, partial [Pseudomonadota bacterium]